MTGGPLQSGDGIRRVLIVEDNTELARVLERALEKHGHHTEVTRNGTEAIVVAQQLLPDSALIDIGLPGLDGIYVARELRRIVPNSLLVAVTGRVDPETKAAALANGFDHYLPKPVDVRAIIEMV